MHVHAHTYPHTPTHILFLIIILVTMSGKMKALFTVPCRNLLQDDDNPFVAVRMHEKLPLT